MRSADQSIMHNNDRPKYSLVVRRFLMSDTSWWPSCQAQNSTKAGGPLAVVLPDSHGVSLASTGTLGRRTTSMPTLNPIPSHKAMDFTPDSQNKVVSLRKRLMRGLRHLCHDNNPSPLSTLITCEQNLQGGFRIGYASHEGGAAQSTSNGIGCHRGRGDQLGL